MKRFIPFSQVNNKLNFLAEESQKILSDIENLKVVPITFDSSNFMAPYTSYSKRMSVQYRSYVDDNYFPEDSQGIAAIFYSVIEIRDGSDSLISNLHISVTPTKYISSDYSDDMNEKNYNYLAREDISFWHNYGSTYINTLIYPYFGWFDKSLNLRTFTPNVDIVFRTARNLSYV